MSWGRTVHAEAQAVATPTLAGLKLGQGPGHIFHFACRNFSLGFWDIAFSPPSYLVLSNHSSCRERTSWAASCAAYKNPVALYVAGGREAASLYACTAPETSPDEVLSSLLPWLMLNSDDHTMAPYILPAVSMRLLFPFFALAVLNCCTVLLWPVLSN